MARTGLAKSNKLLELVHTRPQSPSERVGRVLRYANFAAEPDLPYEMRGLYAKYAHWIARIERHNITDRLVSDLNAAMSLMRMDAVPVLSRKTHKMAFAYADTGQDLDLDAAIAFEIANLVSDGSLQKLKRCQYQKCRKYFLGRADAKTCPGTSCGTLMRRMQRG